MFFIQNPTSINISYPLFIYKAYQKFSDDLSDIPDEIPSNSTEVFVFINSKVYLIDLYQGFKSGISDQHISEINSNFNFYVLFNLQLIHVFN
jgi:hypothetical protein